MVKKYVIFIISLFSLLLISFFCKTIYTEYNLKRITQTQIQENEFTSNKKTLVYLKRINKPKIDIVSDNQGSGNTLYYVEKINDNYFDVIYIKSNGKIKLKSIFIRVWEKTNSQTGKKNDDFLMDFIVLFLYFKCLP